jgi:hypothetical protein
MKKSDRKIDANKIIQPLENQYKNQEVEFTNGHT